MNKDEIVAAMARDGFVERLVREHKDFNRNPYTADLSQDIYITLLNYDEGLIRRLWTDGSMEYFIRRIIKNNLYSTTSNFYYNYQRFRKNSNELQENV